MKARPAKNRTATEGESDVVATFRKARFSLLGLGVIVTLPTPLSPFLGSADGVSFGALGTAAAWCALGFVLDRRASRTDRNAARGGSAGALLLLDVLGLTALLSFEGAAQNPLTMLYFVPMALSTLLVQRWTWTVVGASVLGFASLLGITAHEVGPHAHHGHFFHHIVGMAVALALAGGLVTYFTQRIARALERERALVQKLSRERDQDRVATSLGALAAGAAHELGTPLGTIQLLAGDLSSLDPDELRAAQAAIEIELGRTKEILHGMTSSELSADLLSARELWSLRDFVAELEAADARVQCRVDGEPLTSQPRTILLQIVRELLKNARQASRDDAPLQLSVASDERSIECVVEDTGGGMSEPDAERAFEPFVSNSGGRGLGLFLARVHARQLGGELGLSSRLGVGTRVVLKLPLHPPALTRVET